MRTKVTFIRPGHKDGQVTFETEKDSKEIRQAIEEVMRERQMLSVYNNDGSGSELLVGADALQDCIVIIKTVYRR
jgi:hypothetical protein